MSCWSGLKKHAVRAARRQRAQIKRSLKVFLLSLYFHQLAHFDNFFHRGVPGQVDRVGTSFSD